MNTLDPSTERAADAFLSVIGKLYPVMGIVFNSRARGDHKADSGALLTGLHNSTVNTMFEMIDATYAVELERGIIVSSLLPTWQNQWDHPEQFSNPGLLRNIQREGVRL